jgi:hypothetical protein
MGLSESVTLLKTLSAPCVKMNHDFQKYTMDSMECDSSCSKCCTFHLKTHPHDEPEESDFQSVDSENVAQKKEDA